MSPPESTRDHVSRLAQLWGVELLDPLPGATCSVVVSGRREGANVVLKVPEPHAEEREALPTSLAFSRVGGVEILAFDEPTGGILMPRLDPGSTLSDAQVPDLEAVEVCARLIQRLRTAPPARGISLEKFFSDIDRLPDTGLTRDVRKLVYQLFESTTRQVLLHGDLHHYNILKHGQEWVVIDPKGLIGDPAFEVTGFMRNPITRSFSAAESKVRLMRFHELLGDPIERLWAWSFAQTVLCSLSSAEDGNWKATAVGLKQLKREVAPGFS